MSTSQKKPILCPKFEYKKKILKIKRKKHVKVRFLSMEEDELLFIISRVAYVTIGRNINFEKIFNIDIFASI